MLEEGLVARLIRAAPLAPVHQRVANRVWWLERPEGSQLPALVLTMIWPGTEYNHEERVDLLYARIQFESFGKTYLEAKQVSRAVTAEMEAEYLGENVAFEEALEITNADQKPERLPGGTPVFRILQEFTVPWKVKGD